MSLKDIQTAVRQNGEGAPNSKSLRLLGASLMSTQDNGLSCKGGVPALGIQAAPPLGLLSISYRGVSEWDQQCRLVRGWSWASFTSSQDVAALMSGQDGLTSLADDQTADPRPGEGSESLQEQTTTSMPESKTDV